MSQERTEAIVLRGVDFSETSRIVTLLCPTRGRLACMAKGVRQPKSRLAALLDTFNRLEVVYYWKDGRSVQQLGEASLLDDFQPIKTDLDKATYAAFPMELALKIAHENEPSQSLYNELIGGLERLSGWQGDVRAHTCHHALRMLAAAGFEPALRACCLCGKEALDGAGFSFEGGVTCRSCPADRRLGAGEHRTLIEFNAPALAPGAMASPELFRLVGRYASRQIEADFRSVRVIAQMLG